MNPHIHTYMAVKSMATQFKPLLESYHKTIQPIIENNSRIFEQIRPVLDNHRRVIKPIMEVAAQLVLNISPAKMEKLFTEIEEDSNLIQYQETIKKRQLKIKELITKKSNLGKKNLIKDKDIDAIPQAFFENLDLLLLTIRKIGGTKLENEIEIFQHKKTYYSYEEKSEVIKMKLRFICNQFIHLFRNGVEFNNEDIDSTIIYFNSKDTKKFLYGITIKKLIVVLDSYLEQ